MANHMAKFSKLSGCPGVTVARSQSNKGGYQGTEVSSDTPQIGYDVATEDIYLNT